MTPDTLADECEQLRERLAQAEQIIYAATQVMRDEEQVGEWQARCDVGIRGWLEYEFEMSKAREVRSE